jgi:hypothetical protein
VVGYRAYLYHLRRESITRAGGGYYSVVKGSVTNLPVSGQVSFSDPFYPYIRVVQ